uniref:Uncharacterized protein n=1 Tax=Oncorhynchus tshawytscha TaxID=74940 RepID=A0A8C8FS63_ONCTS
IRKTVTSYDEEREICISNRSSPLSRLDRCKLTYKSCETLASALQTPNSPLRELDLSYNDLEDRGVELLCVGLTSPLSNLHCYTNCTLTTLHCSKVSFLQSLCISLCIDTSLSRLAGCKLTYESCETLASALQTPNSPLRELDLSNNDLEDRGVELLCVGLTSPLCNMERLTGSLSADTKLPLRELDLSHNNDLGDRGVELLCDGLTSPLCNIQTLVLGHCGLTEGCCSALASVLSSPNSQLKQLELRDNDLQDSGVTRLSAGLKDPDLADTYPLKACSLFLGQIFNFGGGGVKFTRLKGFPT